MTWTRTRSGSILMSGGRDEEEEWEETHPAKGNLARTAGPRTRGSRRWRSQHPKMRQLRQSLVNLPSGIIKSSAWVTAGVPCIWQTRPASATKVTMRCPRAARAVTATYASGVGQPARDANGSMPWSVVRARCVRAGVSKRHVQEGVRLGREPHRNRRRARRRARTRSETRPYPSAWPSSRWASVAYSLPRTVRCRMAERSCSRRSAAIAPGRARSNPRGVHNDGGCLHYSVSHPTLDFGPHFRQSEPVSSPALISPQSSSSMTTLNARS